MHQPAFSCDISGESLVVFHITGAKMLFMFTGKLEIKYRKNVPIGKMLKILGKAGKTKRNLAEAWAGIYDAETDELLAEGSTVSINVPNEQFDTSQLAELGWKVYPD
jgi:hypothetical protein